ncbi:MAG: hypothetical protein BWX64_01919 [Acidobacteria bacterium ADurb.Bin051]|nr:MAG: hypothetical protein BWX64_01919 [Acidobacteria bacterium ADurb.Bin051]
MTHAPLTREEFAELRGDVRHLVVQVEHFADALEPIVRARSGDLERLARIEGDLRASHDKHRDASARMAAIEAAVQREFAAAVKRADMLEQRQNRVFWSFLGAAAVLQVLAAVLASPAGRALARLVGGG